MHFWMPKPGHVKWLQTTADKMGSHMIVTQHIPSFQHLLQEHFCPPYSKRYFQNALLCVWGHFINLTYTAVHSTGINRGSTPHNKCTLLNDTHVLAADCSLHSPSKKSTFDFDHKYNQNSLRYTSCAHQYTVASAKAMLECAVYFFLSWTEPASCRIQSAATNGVPEMFSIKEGECFPELSK